MLGLRSLIEEHPSAFADNVLDYVIGRTNLITEVIDDGKCD